MYNMTTYNQRKFARCLLDFKSVGLGIYCCVELHVDVIHCSCQVQMTNIKQNKSELDLRWLYSSSTRNGMIYKCYVILRNIV